MMRPAHIAYAAASPAASGQGALVQRKCACGGAPGPTGACAECRRKKKPGLQAKLRVSQPGDRYEREADQIADRVMRMPSEEALQRAPLAIQRLRPDVLAQRQPEEDENEMLQTRALQGQVPEVSPEAAAQIGAMRGSGHPLASDTRAFFESRFGHDFGRVRIHADARAAQAAQAVQARAFTLGQDVVFGGGQYRPSTAAGRQLLAHELTHVVQQRAGTEPTIQRQPESARKGKILSLKEIAKEPQRDKLRKEQGQVEAKVCTSINFDHCRTVLPPDTEVIILEVKVAGRWLRIDCAGLPGFGPMEQCHVLGTFVKEIPPEQASEPPQEQEPPKPKPKKKKKSKAAKRWSGLPSHRKWKRKIGKKRTYTAINLAIVAKDFWFNEPIDADEGRKILDGLQRKFVDKYLTDSNYEKQFGHMSGFARTGLDMIFIAGRGALRAIENKIRTGQIRPGDAGGEASWDYHLNEFIAAHEIMEVLSGDQAFEEAKNLQALDVLTSGKAGKAFFSGLMDGIQSELSEDDYKTFAKKVAESQALSVVAPPVILSGAAVGIAKDIGEALKGVYELLTAPAEMAKNMAEMVKILLFEPEAAQVLGEAIGAQYGSELQAMTKENVVVFTYKLGELVGPTVVYTVLSLVSGGTVGGAAVSLRLAKFIEKYPKVAAQLKRIKNLMPERKKADPDLPDKPDGKAKGHDGDAPGSKRRVPGLDQCRVGSLFCPIDYLQSEFADLFKERDSADFAAYVRDLSDIDLNLGHSLRREQTILTGDSMYAEFLREVPQDQWSEPFKDALAAAKRVDVDYRNINVDGTRHPWPLDDIGSPWVVHHDPPLQWVKAESNRWWHPMPYRIHDGAHKWWHRLHKKVKARVPEDMFREIFGEDISILEP